MTPLWKKGVDMRRALILEKVFEDAEGARQGFYEETFTSGV